MSKDEEISTKKNHATVRFSVKMWFIMAAGETHNLKEKKRVAGTHRVMVKFKLLSKQSKRRYIKRQETVIH